MRVFFFTEEKASNNWQAISLCWERKQIEIEMYSLIFWKRMEAVILWCWDWRVIYLTTASKSYRQSLPAGMTVSYFHPCCLKLLVKTSLQTSPAVVDFNPTTPSVYVSDCICVFILCFFPLSPFIARLIVSPLSSPSFFFYCISIIFHSNDAQISLSCLRWLIKIHKIKKDKQTKKHGLFFLNLLAW